MQDPGCDQHHRLRLDRNAAGEVVADRLARQGEGRRVEPHRLLHDGAGVDEAGKRGGGVVGPEVDAGDLGGEPLLDRRARRPADRATRTRPPPSSRGRRRSSSPPGRRAGRAGTARRSPGRGRSAIRSNRSRGAPAEPWLAAGGDDPPDQPQPAAAKPPAQHVARARDRRRQQKVEQVRPAETLRRSP